MHIKKGCFTQSLPRRYFHRSLFRAAFRPIQKLGSVAVDPGKVGAHQTSDFGSWPTFWELNREPRTFKAGKPLNNSEFPHQKCGSWPIQVEFTGENWDLTLTIKDVGWTHWRFDLTKKRMILAIYRDWTLTQETLVLKPQEMGMSPRNTQTLDDFGTFYTSNLWWVLPHTPKDILKLGSFLLPLEVSPIRHSAFDPRDVSIVTTWKVRKHPWG